MKGRRLTFAACVVMCLGSYSVAQGSDPSAGRITTVVAPGITSTRQLPQHLQIVRKRLSAGQSVRISQLRELADLGDGFAALRFAQMLEENGANGADIAHYFGISAATGRGGAIIGLLKALDALEADDLSPARSRILKPIVLAYARAGNSYAVEGVLGFQRSGEPFGDLSADLAPLVAIAPKEPAAEIALLLATRTLKAPDPSQTDLNDAVSLLNLAAKSQSLQTAVTAQNLQPLLQQKIDNLALANLEASQ